MSRKRDKKKQIQFSRFQIALIILASIFVFFAIFLPHINNPFPLHMDEWHHITEAINLQKGEYIGGVFGYEIGFHAILAFFSSFIDLVLFYKFLPAIWGALTSLVFFFVVYNLTEKRFPIALLSMVFFGLIRSSENLLGLQFFTPLSFSIPFIFLFLHFFIKGLREERKKEIIISFFILLFLVPIYSLSILFMLPLIVILTIVYRKHAKKNYKVFLLFLLIPLAGLLFHSLANNSSLLDSFIQLAGELRFEDGWIKFAKDNLPTEIYPITGYLFAIAGFIAIIAKKQKKYLPCLIWTAYPLILILLFKVFQINFITPYQRNIYFFAISLPLLSAVGAHFLFNLIKKSFKENRRQKIILIIAVLFLAVSLIFLISQDAKYFRESYEVEEFMTWGDYADLVYLSSFQKGRVLTPSDYLETVKPISGHEPVATAFFYSPENKAKAELFYNIETNCTEKESIIREIYADYIISPGEILCEGYSILSSENNFIYEVNLGKM